MTFGAWLRAQRLAMNLTQDALGGLAGIANTRISDYENDRRLPSFDDAVALAYELQLNVYETVTRMMKERLMATEEGRIFMAEFRAGRFYDDDDLTESESDAC